MSRYETIKNKLDEKIPRDVVSSRSGGAGRSLSYLEGWYVIDRLNAVFGQGNWAYGITQLNLCFSGEVSGKHYTSYTAQVKLVVKFDEGITTEFIDVGFGDGTDAQNIGKTHELATKEAVTDALKRCAKNLGNSTGLALYDKTQENVDDGKTERSKADAAPPAPTAGPKAAPLPRNQAQASAANNRLPSRINVGGGSEGPVSETVRSELVTRCRAVSRAVVSAQKKTAAEVRAWLKETYGSEDLDSVPTPQLEIVFTELNSLMSA